MTMFAFICAAIALLAGAGWWIGHQVTRETQRVFAPSLNVNVHAAAREPLLHAMTELGIPSHRIVFVTNATQGQVAHVTISACEGGITASCITTPVHARSFALQRIPVAEEMDAQTWRRVATLLLRQTHTTTHDILQGRGAPGSCDPAFERHYLSAWKNLQSRDEHGLRSALNGLRSALAQWPGDRDAEKAVALANLADLCRRMPETPVTRLARRLEGYAAACEALELQYSLPTQCRLQGLRQLVRGLHADLAIHGTNAIQTLHERSYGLSDAACPQTSTMQLVSEGDH